VKFGQNIKTGSDMLEKAEDVWNGGLFPRSCVGMAGRRRVRFIILLPEV